MDQTEAGEERSPDPIVPEADATEFVQSFARGLAVIRAFDADHPSLTLSEVARRAEVPRAAARRFLLTLVALGYVRSGTVRADEGRSPDASRPAGGGRSGSAGGARFALTPRVLELGFSYLSSLSLPEVVQPHLEHLSREVDESVSAAVLDASDIVYIARVPTRRIMSVRITIGTRFPAFATSMGRVLLAGLPAEQRDAAIEASVLARFTDRTLTDPAGLRQELERVREQGWALVDGELEPGLRSVAAPLHGRNGTVVAAVNVSTSATRDSVEHLIEAYVPPLLRTADAITAELRLV